MNSFNQFEMLLGLTHKLEHLIDIYELNQWNILLVKYKKPKHVIRNSKMQGTKNDASMRPYLVELESPTLQHT